MEKNELLQQILSEIEAVFLNSGVFFCEKGVKSLLFSLL